MKSDEPSLFAPDPRQRSWTVAGTAPATAQPAAPPPAADLELFQAGAAEADGYARWRAEAQAQRAAEAAQRRATELPVAASAEGYATWKAEVAELRRAFEQRWGVPLGKRVRVRLSGEWQEHEGVLRLADEKVAENGRPLALRLGDHVFAASKIESVVRVD